MSRNHHKRHKGHKKKFFHKRHPPAGAAPGTLVVHPETGTPTVQLVQYSPESVREEAIGDVERLRGLVREDCVTWVDVQGLGDETYCEPWARSSNCTHWNWKISSTYPNGQKSRRTLIHC